MKKVRSPATSGSLSSLKLRRLNLYCFSVLSIECWYMGQKPLVQPALARRKSAFWKFAVRSANFNLRRARRGKYKYKFPRAKNFYFRCLILLMNRLAHCKRTRSE